MLSSGCSAAMPLRRTTETGISAGSVRRQRQQPPPSLLLLLLLPLLEQQLRPQRPLDHTC